jgi:hypothetical protein
MTDLLPANREDRQARATYCDAYVRQFDTQMRNWAVLGKLIVEVEKDELYRELGYHSADDWMLHAAPVSRRLCYAVKSRFLELSNGFSFAELQAMPPQTAEFAKWNIPLAARKDPRVKRALTHKRKDAIEILKAECADLHVENVERKGFTFSESQWTVIYGAIQKCRDAYGQPSMSYEDAMEAICVEFLQ